MAKVELKGFRELEKALRDLPDNIGRGVARRAVKQAGEDMADAQRRRIPVRSGALRDSVVVKVSTRSLDGLEEYGEARKAGATSREAARALRAARREAKQSGSSKGHRIAAAVGPTEPHAHLVEFGTDPRWTTGGGKADSMQATIRRIYGFEPAYRGVMPAQPYMRPAFDEEVDESIATIREGLAEEVDRAQQRIARKAARAAKKASR